MEQQQYSEEEVGLYNPAYIGFILYSCIREYVENKVEGMHCALPFVVVPMAMSNTISHRLPKQYSTSISSWVTKNEGVLIDLVEQAESYIPIVQSACSFLLHKELITMKKSGTLLLKDSKLSKIPSLFNKSVHMKNSLRASRFLGKWFSHAPTTEIIFIQLGIRP
ncbi:three component ABC system middle component [Spartinivicinus poritis]|uniref:DUF6521 family protein n=1 Tax=Spartinivicinus poritis TaxID=2994640 RepID=A0ABT5U7T0_9GAMM|nr:three component ABC system middle component [Spartinivicinus sp. A2-2]MDE1462425.1 DUF6521 family protein [Spartinivicinus sp. A2-2]